MRMATAEKSRSKTGRRNSKGMPVLKTVACKDCRKAGVTTARPAPEPGPRCATHWREERARRRTAAHGRHVETTYGITAEQYAALYAAQGGCCAGCQRATGRTKKLAVDHDHACCPGPTSCGRCARGLLCGHCNREIVGYLRDDPAAFDRLAEYLRNPPARRVLGLRP
jgi:hypothetical protein